MAKRDGRKPIVFQNVTQLSNYGTYTLENLPDEVRRMLPAELLEQMRQGAVSPDVSALQPGNPDFDQVAFVERASAIIDATREAEENGERDMARPFMSIRFFRRWSPWAEQQRASSVARPLAVTRQVEIAAAHSDAQYDRVTVRVAESSPSQPIQPPVMTLWTFLRSAAGRSEQQTDSFATVCTNCGAPVDVTNQTTCRYCGAGVASLGPEWILDDVTADGPASNLVA
jgi:hypothetical protein